MPSNIIRTDLALEARESVNADKASMHGLRVEEFEKKEDNVKITRVYIETKNAAKLIGKNMGTYVTIETPGLEDADNGIHREISKHVCREIRRLLKFDKKPLNVLIVGLGNRAVTADSLGPRVVDNLFINRHMIKNYGMSFLNENRSKAIVSSIEPGVMAKTGMETLEIVKGIVERTNPDVVMAVDALAARSTRRLNRTIQITDSGIQPGSGVGNHRDAIDMDTLGVPVIAVGVPTVVDAATIVRDVLDRIVDNKVNYECLKSLEDQNLLSELNNMYMTGKDIDAVIKRISFTLSEGINRALSGR